MDSMNAKRSASYFKEKAIVGLSKLTGDEVDKAVVKATSHMLKAPKEKYMQHLLAASYEHFRGSHKDGFSISEYIVQELVKRLHTYNWIVVLKTLVVFHRLLCDGSDRIVSVICLHQGAFSAHELKELSDDASGAAQKVFIEEYMSYIQVRCVVQRQLGWNRRIDSDDIFSFLASLNVKSMAPVFEVLLQLLEELVHVDYHEYIVDNFCTMEAYELVIRDGKRLYQLLSKPLLFILDGFETFSLSEKRTWLTFYRRYEAAQKSLKALFDFISSSFRVFSEPVPSLVPLPPSLLERLEEDVRMSELPQEKCTLESLGVSSERPTCKDVDELLPESATDPELAATKASPQTNEKAVVAPASPLFDMDDLFEPAAIQVATPPVVTPPVATTLADVFAGIEGQAHMHGQSLPPPDVHTCSQSPHTIGVVHGSLDGNVFGNWSSGAPSGQPSLSGDRDTQMCAQNFAPQRAEDVPPPHVPTTAAHRGDDAMRGLYETSRAMWSPSV